MFCEYNPNPSGKIVGDCAIRAISKALGTSWEQTYCSLVAAGYNLCDLPNANHVWGSHLRKNGFVRKIMDPECPDCYSVSEFCAEHPEGTYVLALSGHVVCVVDGTYFDTWDSGGETVLYYWEKV